ncbi:MAG: urea carboxylase-associated family protein [Pseudomonadota bacterium]|nr:urea carboxylase-associated family protein [Pseudomonadota bacterium]
MAAEPVTIPARLGKAARLDAGQSLKLTNTHGSQVVDTWAFVAADMSEFMSMEHSRVAIGGVFPHVGDTMVTNRREPILTLLEDTSPGIHDTLIAACDRYRYEMLGCEGHHDSCTDNLAAALGEMGMTPPETPSPWNMWMNIPVGADGSVSFEAPVSSPGDYVTLRAKRDIVIVFSCCPQDVIPINGADCVPKECHFEILN